MTDLNAALAETRADYAGAPRPVSEELRRLRKETHDLRLANAELRLKAAALTVRNRFLEVTLNAENDRVRRSDELEGVNESLRKVIEIHRDDAAAWRRRGLLAEARLAHYAGRVSG